MDRVSILVAEQVSESQIPVSQEQFDQARQQFQSVFPERSDQTPQQPSRSGIGERFLQSQRELAFTPRPDQPMDPRAAIAFRALNSLLLGAPAAFNENYSELVQAAGEDSRIASAIGDIAGFLVPGGLALKGVKGVAGRAGLAGGGRVTQAGVGGAAALGEGALYAGTVDPTTRGEMPSLAVLGVLVFLNLQYSLLFKNNNISDFIYLKDQNTELLSKISKIMHNNNILKNDIQELSSSTHALENFARYNLGLVKKDEIFIQVIKK